MSKPKAPAKPASLESRLRLSHLLVGIVPAAVVALVLMFSARSSFRDVADQRLASAGAARAMAVQSLADSASTHVAALARDRVVADALLGTLTALEAESSRAEAASAGLDARMQSFLAEIGYGDVYLVDTATGNVVYSADGNVSPGEALPSGTQLSAAYKAAKTAAPNARPSVVSEPTQSSPSSYIAAPVYSGSELAGVVAYRLPLDRVSAVIGAVHDLGETGDAFLVGPDGRLRSKSVHSPSHAIGASVDFEAVQRGAAGESGVTEATSLLGNDALTSYNPVNLGKQTFVLIATQDVSEAMAPARTTLFWSLGLLVLASAAVATASFSVSRTTADTLASLAKSIAGQWKALASGGTGPRAEAAPSPYVEFSSLANATKGTAEAFAAQLDAVPVPIVIRGADSKTRFANRAAASLADASQDQLRGGAFYDAVKPGGAVGAEAALRKTLDGGGTAETKGSWTVGGRSHELRSVQAPLEVDGKIVGVLEAFLDETEFNALEGSQSKVDEYISEAVEQLEAAFDRVIDGDLSATFTPPSAFDASLGDTANHFMLISMAFDRTVAEFRRTIETTQSNAKRSANAAQDLSRLAADLLRYSEATSKKSLTVASATEQMSINIDSVASAAEEMSINVGSVSENATATSTRMRDVAGAIERLSTSIGDVAQAAADGSNVAADASAKSTQANEAMETLGRAATEIDKVTEVIKRIAEKTNLLALNATIEAASAGEAGKGFAVVAHEVKELASQCSSAAEDITERIAGVQRNTNEAMQVITAMTKIIEELAKVSDSISVRASEQDRAVSEISASVSSVDAGVEATASAIAEIVQGANDVSRNAGELTAGSSAIASSFGEVNDLASSGENSARAVGEAADSLGEVVANLETSVERFRSSGSRPSDLKVA